MLTEEDVITVPVRCQISTREPLEISLAKIAPVNFSSALISCSSVSITPQNLSWSGNVELRVEYEWAEAKSQNAESHR